jgi:hypothetical protein
MKLFNLKNLLKSNSYLNKNIFFSFVTNNSNNNKGGFNMNLKDSNTTGSNFKDGEGHGFSSGSVTNNPGESLNSNTQNKSQGFSGSTSGDQGFSGSNQGKSANNSGSTASFTGSPGAMGSTGKAPITGTTSSSGSSNLGGGNNANSSFKSSGSNSNTNTGSTK